MILKERIEALEYLGEVMRPKEDVWAPIIAQAKQKNPWFTDSNIIEAIDAVSLNYLGKQVLRDVQSKYDKLERSQGKRVGIIAAGNIPLVGIHDIISCFLTGNIAVIKFSDKDSVLIPHCITLLTKKYPDAEKYFEIVERLESFDAVIATGSDNTSRYFEYYFGKYPNIIRKNRNALGVLSGKETEEELLLLGKDIFSYFGLGCRNVSKIFIPKEFPLAELMKTFEHYRDIAFHNKYKNNLDYNAAIYLLNRDSHLISDFLVMRESSSLSSRISCLHYQYYEKIEEVQEFIKSNSEKIQCVVTQLNLENANTFKFGEAQKPEFLDFADNVDTINFLQAL